MAAPLPESVSLVQIDSRRLYGSEELPLLLYGQSYFEQELSGGAIFIASAIAVREH